MPTTPSTLARESFREPGRHPGFRTGSRVWLLRHGEVHADWQGRAYGGLDVPLSEHGALATRGTIAAFARIPLRAVFTSPLERARILGEGLSRAAGVPLLVRAGLAEIQRGAWQGRSFAELSATCPLELAASRADPWRYAAHGGENDADVLARAWPVLEEAVRTAGGASVALTCHYNVIRILCARALGIPPAESLQMRIEVSSACLLEDRAEGWALSCSNVERPPDAPGPPQPPDEG
jgi:broad specificity phosphatase PhoE